MKVLVADDSLVIRRVIEKILSAMGHAAVPAINGEQALEILKQECQDINLVLLDWNMPGMNGLEVVKAMQVEPRYRDIPVLMVSTESEHKNIEEAIYFGARGYVTKPFTPQDLSSKVGEVLSSPTAW